MESHKNDNLIANKDLVMFFTSKLLTCFNDGFTLGMKLYQLGLKTILNYWMMVERYPNLKEDVAGSIPGSETFSLLHKKLVRWSTALVVFCLNKLKN